MLVFAAFSAALAMAATALEDRFLGSGAVPLAAVLVFTAAIPLGRAVVTRNRYVVKVAATWMSGPGKKQHLTLSREQLGAVKRKNAKLIVESTEEDPIVIPLRYYSDAFRLESAVQGFVSGVKPWIIRRTAQPLLVRK